MARDVPIKAINTSMIIEAVPTIRKPLISWLNPRKSRMGSMDKKLSAKPIR